MITIKGFERFYLVGPVGEYIVHGDGSEFAARIYPGRQYRDCRINGEAVSPIVYLRYKNHGGFPKKARRVTAA